MKIENRGNPQVELTKSKFENKKSESESSQRRSDRVEAKISKSLQNLERAIQSSQVGIAEVHSGLDEQRIDKLMASLERVEARQPRLSEADILEMADQLADKIQRRPLEAADAFYSPNPDRVADLLA